MINFNGTLVGDDSFYLNQANSAFLSGRAIFEDIRVVGGRPIFFEAHYFRIMAGMRMLRMEIPMEYTMEFFEEQIAHTLAPKEVTGTYGVTLSVFETINSTDHNSNGGRTCFHITLSTLVAPGYKLAQDGYEVELFKEYLIHEDPLSKLDTNHKVVETVAGIFALENGYDDCLLLNTSKMVVGTTQGPLFLVKDGNIKTAPLNDGAKNRVIRQKLIAMSQTGDRPIQETSISPFELQKSDELFTVNTFLGIIPITKYRKKTYDNRVAREFMGKLNAHALSGD